MINKEYLKLFDESDFTVKFYSKFSENDWVNFLDGYGKIFRNIPKSVFEWYFMQTNYFTIISNKDCDVVGLYGLLKIKVNYNSKKIDSFLCHNVGIKSEYSGKGLFQFIAEKSLSKYSKKEDNIVLGFPNKASFKGHIRIGWESFFDVGFLKFNNLEKNIKLSKKYTFTKVNKFNKELDSCIDRFNGNFSINVLKNSEFLNWRLNKPNNNYICYLMKKNEELQGYLILKDYKQNNEKRLHLVDYNFINIEALNEIVKFSIKFFQNGNFDFLNTWIVKHSLYEKIFLQQYFVEQPEFPIYPVILFQKGSSFDFENINKERAFFTLFDNDVF